jgi:hypothetical protein
MLKNGLDVAYYLILAAIVLAIIMNARNFTIAVAGVDSAVNNTFSTVAGSGYKAA